MSESSLLRDEILISQEVQIKNCKQEFSHPCILVCYTRHDGVTFDNQGEWGTKATAADGQRIF